MLKHGFGCWSQDRTTAGLAKTNKGGNNPFHRPIPGTTGKLSLPLSLTDCTAKK